MGSFWNDAGLEPKRSFRFLLSIMGAGTKLDNFLIKKVSKPSFSISESEHKFLNHTFYYPGKLTWNEVTFTVVDVVHKGSDATSALMNMLDQTGYELPIKSVDNPKTLSKQGAVSAFTIVIRQIDANGLNVEEWYLHNSWFKDIKFGELSYDTEDLLNVDVTVRYDNAHVVTMDNKYPSNALGPG